MLTNIIRSSLTWGPNRGSTAAKITYFLSDAQTRPFGASNVKG